MSEIKIKIGAELDMASVQGEVQRLVKQLESEAKFKVGADVKSAKDQLGLIKKEYEGMKDLQIKTTVQDGELTKVVARYKELDGTAKSIQHTMNKKTGMFEASKIDSTVKSMEKIDGLTNKEIQSRTKLISFEKQLNSLKEKSYKIKDKGSDEYKKAEADIQRLTATTKQYQGSLEGVSRTKLNDLNSQIKEVDKNTDQLWKTQQRVNKEKFDFNKVGGQMESAGRGIMAVTAPVVAFGVASVKASTDFESSFAGVRKTVDATEQEFTQLSDGFREMSKTMPQSASNLAEIGEIAGQLGIEVPNIQSFTKTIADMAVTTDMTSQEAGTSMAKFANIMGTSQGDFDRLGSSIVDLGNHLSTSEKPILELGLGLAGVAKQVGMTEGSTLGLAGALSSVGIGAERGASSVSKALIDMQLATETGGESLEQFAKVAGMSSEQFSQAFKDDAGGAFVSFIKGLKNIEEDGGSVIATLDEMGISEIRLRDTLIRATNASDLFSDSMDRGNNAFNENVALSNEANQRYETTASKLEMMRNRVTDVAISLGGALAPSVIDIADKIANLVEKFGALDVSTQASIVKFGAFGMVAGTSLNVLGKGFRNLDTMKGLLETITGGFGGVSKGVEGASTSVSAFTKMGSLISAPYVIGAVAIVGAIALISKAWSNHKKEVEETATRQDEFFRDYETNSKKNAEGIEYLKENGAEYDRLTEKMGANQDITKLTANELARYNDLVKNMDGFGVLNGQLDEHGNMIADTTDGYRDLIKAMEETQAIADRKIVSDFNKQKDSIAKNIDGIKTGGEYGRAQKQIVEIELMLDSNYEMAINKDGEWDFKLDAGGNKISLTPERREELQLQLDDHKITVSDADIELEMENDKIREMLNANLSLATRDLEIPDSAKESFKTMFDDLIEIDPISAMDNGKKLSESFAKTMDTLKKEFDLTGDFSVDPLRAYGEELTNMGIKHGKVSQQIGEMGYTLQGNEGHIQAISSAMEEFSNTGALSETTISSLSEKFNNLGLSTEMSGAEILTAIGSVDKYASSLMMGEEAFKGFDQAQQEMINSIKNSNDVLDENSASKMVEGIKQSTQEALTETETMKTGMLEAIDGMKGLFPDDVLAEFREGVIRDAEETEARINSMELEGFNELIKKSLNDDGSFGEFTQGIIDEIEKLNGIEFDHKEMTFTVESEGVEKVEEDVQALNGIWQENPETKEYEFIEMGAEDVERAVTALNGVFVQNKETKEFEFVETGADGVITQAEAVKMGWEWNPETKEFISKEDGSTVVIDGTNGMKTAWSYDPVTKTFVSKITGVRDVVTGVQRAKEAWESMKSDTKNFVMNFKRTDTITTRNVTTQETLYGPRRKYTGTKSFASGTESFSPNGYASGTPTSSGMGMAYVAELGQELLVYPNNDIALTGHKPELRNMPRGTQIFNHKDTEALLRGDASLPIEDFDYNNMKSGAMVNQAVKSGQSVPSFAKGNSKAKKNEKVTPKNTKSSKKDTDKAEYDRYMKLESALDRLNNKLDILKHKEKTIFNDAQIINSQKDRIKFYEEQKKAVHSLANEMRAERDELQKSLKGKGFNFIGSGDELKITNPEKIKGQTKEIETDLKRFFELQDKEIPSQQKLWLDYAKAIKETSVELDRFFILESNAKYAENDMALLKAKQALLNNNQDLVDSKREELKLNELIQKNLSDHADELRREREEIEEILKLEGIRFTGKGDDRRVINLREMEGKSKKVLELAERYNEVASEVSSKTVDFLSAQLEAENIKLDKMSAEFELQSRIVEKLADKMEDYNYQLKIIDEDNFEDRVKYTTKQLANMEQQMFLNLKAFNDLGENGFKKGGRESKAFEEEQKRLKKQLEENTIAIKEYKEALESIKEGLRLKFIEDQNKLYQDQQDRLSDLADIQEFIVQVIRKRGEEERKQLDESHKKEMESLETRHKDRKKKYDEDLDLFRKTVQAKIDALDEQYEGEDYEEELAKEQEKANEIQAEINKLSMDDSIEARTRVVELRKQLANQNEVIFKKQQRRERDLLKKSLQDQIKDEEQSAKDKGDIADKVYDDEKKRIEEDYKINSEHLDRKYADDKVYAEAKESIIRGTVEVSKGAFVDVYDAYTDFENKFGKGMGILGDIIKKDFLNKLSQAQEAIKNLDYEVSNAITKVEDDYQLQKGDEGYDKVQDIDKELENSRDEVKEDVGKSRLEQYQEDYQRAEASGNWKGMIDAHKGANQERGNGYKITDAKGKILEVMGSAYKNAERSGDWRTAIDIHKTANEIRGLGSVISSDQVDNLTKILGVAYNKAMDNNNWQEMLEANLTANELRGKGRILTARSAINTVRKRLGLGDLQGYSQGGKDTKGGLAMLHGTKSKPEYIWNTDQYKDLAKMIAQHEFTMPDFSGVQLSIDPSTLFRMRSSNDINKDTESIELKIDNLINVEGNMDKNMLGRVQSEGNNILNKLKSALNKNGVTRGVKV